MNKERLAQVAFLLLRVVSGLLLFQPGAMKIFGWYGGMPPGAHLNTQMMVGGWMEIVGGLLIILGLFTRPVAFLVAGEMAVAYFQFHQPNGTWPVQNQGAPAALLCFIFLFVCANGAGPWSLDGMMAAKKARSTF